MPVLVMRFVLPALDKGGASAENTFPMAADSSFDIVSDINLQEMDNAVNQAVKEITTRYDFKGTSASLEFNRKDKELTLTGDAESQLEAVKKVLIERMLKRGADAKALDPQKIEQ